MSMLMKSNCETSEWPRGSSAMPKPISPTTPFFVKRLVAVLTVEVEHTTSKSLSHLKPEAVTATPPLPVKDCDVPSAAFDPLKSHVSALRGDPRSASAATANNI